MCASVSRSIDDTEDIYPVVMTPANWANYLSTAFKPEDILADEGTVRLQLLAAEKERGLLIRQKNNLLAGAQDIKALETAQINARNDLAAAQRKLAAGYSERALSAIQMYFDTVSKNANDKAAAVLNLTDTSKDELDKTLKTFSAPPLSSDQWTQVKQMQSDCFKQQEAAQLAGEAYSRAQLAASLARGKDASVMIATLEDQIQSLELDIDFYKKSLSGSINPTGNDITQLDKDGKAVATPTKAPETGADGNPDPKYNGKVDSNIKIPEQATGASIWQEIVLAAKSSKKEASSALSSSVSHSDWAVSLFFGSASGSSDASSSTSNIKHSSKDTDIKIGMRVMKVSIDRPWMNTQLLNQSQEFFHYNATPFSGGAPTDIKNALAKPTDTSAQKFLDNASNTLIPSWTTGFIVAKDVHIIMSSETEFNSAETSDMQKTADSGGGILCFSCSKSESSSDHSSKTSFTSDAKTLSIKIPAPQVLGWISHLAPEDKCTPNYSSLPADQLRVKDQEVPKPLEVEAPTDGFAARGAVRAGSVAAPKPVIQASSNHVVSTPAPEKGFVDGFAAPGRFPVTPSRTSPIVAN